MKLYPINFTGKLYRFYTYKFFYHPGKNRVVKFLKSFFKNGIAVVENETKVKYLLDINDYISSQILEFGHYEGQSLSIAREICKDKDGFFIDIGANFGLYTCYLLSANKNIKSISIDASYKAFDKLINNAKINSFQHRTIFSNTALSNSFGVHFFSPNNEYNLGSSRIINNESKASKYMVCSMTLNYLLNEIKPDNICLMKIDVEGHEEQVLDGLDLNGPYRPENILIEYEPVNNPKVQELKEKLIGAKYEAYDIYMKKYCDGDDLPESNILFRSII